jgi:hypothetical protein
VPWLSKRKALSSYPAKQKINIQLFATDAQWLSPIASSLVQRGASSALAYNDCLFSRSLDLLSPSVAAGSLGVNPTTPEGRDITEKAMIFLVIRDIAVAGALFWLYGEGNGKEMGVILTAWTAVFVVDTWVTTQGLRGWDKGVWGLCGWAAVVAFGGHEAVAIIRPRDW